MNPIGGLQRFAIGALAVIIIGGLLLGWVSHKAADTARTTALANCSVRITKLDTRGTDACAQAIAMLKVKYDTASAQAEAAAQARLTNLRANYAAIDARHAQELQHVQQDADRVAADLRAGNLRLRQQWRGCEAAAGVPSATAGAGQPDASADVRTASAAAIVRIAADADARVRALQRVIKADRADR